MQFLFISLCVIDIYHENIILVMPLSLHAVNQSTNPNLLNRLNLTPADRDGVTDITSCYGNQAGVAHALRAWRKMNPSRATFRALVEVAIGLRRGDTATDICRFIVENTSGTDRN